MSLNINTSNGGDSPPQYRLANDTLSQAKEELEKEYEQKLSEIDSLSTDLEKQQGVETNQLETDLDEQSTQLKTNRDQFLSNIARQSLAAGKKEKLFEQQLQKQELERAKRLEERRKLLEQRKQKKEESSEVLVPQEQRSQVEPLSSRQWQNFSSNFDPDQICPSQVSQVQKQAYDMQQQMKQIQSQNQQEQKIRNNNCKIS